MIFFATYKYPIFVASYVGHLDASSHIPNL